MTVKFGLLALLEAKPDKGADLAAFLVAGRELALQEQGTVTWYAFLTSRYMAVLFRQRISRRLTEGMALGMALESLTAANLAYAQQPDAP